MLKSNPSSLSYKCMKRILRLYNKGYWIIFFYFIFLNIFIMYYKYNNKNKKGWSRIKSKIWFHYYDGTVIKGWVGEINLKGY